MKDQQYNQNYYFGNNGLLAVSITIIWPQSQKRISRLESYLCV